MIWKIRLTSLLLMVALTPSCVLRDLVGDSSLNESAIYDPPTITLIKGYDYPFKEGNLMGRGQKFHSDFSYRRAIIIGNDSNLRGTQPTK
tara:strand:+ start:657 stop:926 length:270 start_codon:yes stop_codon:yes gene_type:complete